VKSLCLAWKIVVKSLCVGWKVLLQLANGSEAGTTGGRLLLAGRQSQSCFSIISFIGLLLFAALLALVAWCVATPPPP
jgi:hypothetical protein